MLKEPIRNESDFRSFLESKGFATNNRKKDNENGYDIIAIKDGYSFLIEFKLLEIRDNGTYRMSGDILGDILVLATPKGNAFLSLSSSLSLTKAARFIDVVNE